MEARFCVEAVEDALARYGRNIEGCNDLLFEASWREQAIRDGLPRLIGATS
jgi:hypothetical protein